MLLKTLFDMMTVQQQTNCILGIPCSDSLLPVTQWSRQVAPELCFRAPLQRALEGV